MFGTASHLGSLELRKQLLIAESELNRAQLTAEWQGMAQGVSGLAHHAQIGLAWASCALLIAAEVKTLWAAPPRGTTVKVSWFERILEVARVASTIWFALRGRGGKAGDK